MQTKFKTVFFILLFLGGCATKELKLASDPVAKVYVSSDFSSEFSEIGQTPLTVNLKDYADNDKFAYFSFRSDGYSEQKVVVPTSFTAGSIEVKLTKDEELEAIEERIKAGYEAQMKVMRESIESQRQVFREDLAAQRQDFIQEKEKMESSFKGRSNRIFQKVMEFQNAVNIKRLAKASKALSELKRLNAPQNLLLTLEGNFEFINGRFGRAIASYQRALDLDPNNVELSSILNELKKVVR